MATIDALNQTTDIASPTSERKSQLVRDSSSIRNDLEPADEEEEAFIEKYFAKEIPGGVSKLPKLSVTFEQLTTRQSRLASVQDAKERLKRQPYAEAIKHLRKISNTISPAYKLSLISEVCRKVDENVL